MEEWHSGGPCTSHYLAELRSNIQARDRIKAAILLSYFPTLDPPLQQRVLFELSRDPGDFVVDILGHLLANVIPIGSIASAVRLVLIEKIIDQPATLLTLLICPEYKDKMVFIELAGELQMEAAVPCLMTMLQHETDRHVLSTLVTTLGNIGHPAATNVLADYLYADTQALVKAAVQGLAHIATPTAIQRLAERMGTDSELDRLILDAFATTQDSLALTKLNEALRSHHASMRNHAKTLLHRLGPKVVPLLLENLRYPDDPALLIHSLNVLGAIEDGSAATPIRKLLHNEPHDANVRFAAYEALGLLPLHKGAFMLAEGLADPVEHVRIAAARAIERHANEIILAGIKNLLAQDDTQARHTVVALLQAEADALVMHLIDDATFQHIAVSYLGTEAHPDLRRHFDKLLRQHGYSAIANRLRLSERSPQATGHGLIYAVDDSRMMLKIYQHSLHQLGFTAVLFEFPTSALAQMCQVKPDVLLTDLNMPEMTGIELTTRLRTMYTPEQLPIIMVTTQQDQPAQDTAYGAGVSAILPKPFTVEQLDTVLQRFV